MAKRDLDSPQDRLEAWRTSRRKSFLRRLYADWYGLIARELAGVPGPVLELGAGPAGTEFCPPGCLRSDIQPMPGISIQADARSLPFGTETLGGILMINVLHHIPDVAEFFRQAVYVLKPGGRMVMIEPWITPVSRFIYTFLHHEPCQPDAQDWAFASTGPLSGANEALAWMIFHRDAEKFARDFPELSLVLTKPIMPVRYLLSGGLRSISLLPGSCYAAVAWIEDLIAAFNRYLAMFALIVVERQAHRP
jgi:SAM-dependent methyltransferase